MPSASGRACGRLIMTLQLCYTIPDERCDMKKKNRQAQRGQMNRLNRPPVLIEQVIGEDEYDDGYVNGFNIVSASPNEWEGEGDPNRHFFNKWQLDALNRPTPHELIRSRKGKGGTNFLYVPVSLVVGILNRLFHGNWSFETEIVHCPIPPTPVKDEEVIVKGRLTVTHNGITVVKEQYGQQTLPFPSPKDKDGNPIRTNDYVAPGMTVGDALKGAGSDALRKCAFLLGVCADLYNPVKDNRPNPTQFAKYEAFPEGLYSEVETPREAIADTNRRVLLQQRVEGLGEIYQKRFAGMLENITRKMAPENAVPFTLSNVPILTLENLERWVNDAQSLEKSQGELEQVKPEEMSKAAP